ncbi:MAG: hypothetical protein IKB64_01505 [Paludibacteraceae bacterium]|nr:hypothetical protein [Paludibacteraceae bacterium]
MALTPSQIRQIKKVIEEHMNVIMELTIGDTKVSPETLKKIGVPKSVSNLITDSYKYGKLTTVMNKNLSKMSPQEVNDMLKKLKVSSRQQKSMEYLKAKTQLSIDNLTQRMTSAVITSALQNQLDMYQAIGQVVPEAVKKNTDRYKVVQQLRDLTQDWERDWHRVAHSEMWDAKVQGEANAIMDNESPISKKGKDTMVFKRPAPNACNKCKQLYLEADGITPKLFKITELQANGSNYGKKQADWKPTLGILHPNCMCPLSVMPDGYKFDSSGQLTPDTTK